MAVLAAAALLDELMGRNRNIAPDDKGKELNWEDPEYCKLYLVKFCPHDLFVNTRADLGQCAKIHDDEAKSLYEKSHSYKKQQYEDEFIRFCQSMLNEVERKIVKGKQRLALIGKADAISLSPAQTQRNEEQIKFLTEKINSLVDEAEQMGIQGNVEQAQGLMKLCDQLKEEREQLRGNNENSHWQQTAELAAAQEKQMEVCDVCGAFLIVGDAQQRIDDHLMGKQHVGYARLKMAMEELINNRQKSRDDKERKREEERRERARLREEEEHRRDRERDREREERRKKREEEERHRNRPKHRSRSPRTHRRSSSRSRSSTRSSRDKDYNRRSVKSCEERGRSSRNSRSKSRDQSRDHRRKAGDEHDRDHHRRSNKDRGLNGDYGRRSSPSQRPSSRHHQDPKAGRSSGGREVGHGDE
ncbi:Luc7-like protein 3 [Cryptotermes secundus]|uniref:Luc7-like protein 3 n=1 Tax=Cryptotermes secundus TaxID=105785 RepID=A0A2J7QEC9_9NEOP|nr:luc7-like protein 3 [Cryptotermes secundus]PNF26933.1 Luc7-like protein 3 [Cryptotermes secundus]PNF26934.1 Luc7-like protein 3 [Cryptotermes secundus]PNF26935.1 Luc7-like protein 3 [Cryptotermes secundus]PNF26936.1 Luc7-like protein 3 [Cryptotermes secundus]